MHELTTGPELWEQTGGRITHLVAGVGTGGTMSGTGRFLKQFGVEIVGADPEASVYSGGDGSPYFVESVGQYRHPATVDDTWPAAFDQGVVDRFERIPDRESLLLTRRLAREEGLLVGASAGMAVAAALRVAAGLGPEHTVVAVLPDSGRNYLSKYFDDDWMIRLGFLDAPSGPYVRDAVPTAGLAVAHPGHTIAEVLAAYPDRMVAVVTARRVRRPDPLGPRGAGRRRGRASCARWSPPTRPAPGTTWPARRYRPGRRRGRGEPRRRPRPAARRRDRCWCSWTGGRWRSRACESLLRHGQAGGQEGGPLQLAQPGDVARRRTRPPRRRPARPARAGSPRERLGCTS